MAKFCKKNKNDCTENKDNQNINNINEEMDSEVKEQGEVLEENSEENLEDNLEDSESKESKETEEETEPEVTVSPEVKILAEKCAELQEKYLRLAAEYDNFRKRSAKEKETVYSDAYAAAVAGILPIMDNIERAAQFATDDSEISKGIHLLQNQCVDALEKMGVHAMESTGAEFNPDLHNAIMHEEDDSDKKNVVSETFQKGYTYGDKVIRYAMVKVLN
jgi:molecular chaperone GrpE